MAIFKCKMCGGDLNVTDTATVCECEYCGTNQTIPSSRDEEITNLFLRAEMLRRKCDFDRAEQTYEKILELDSKEAEAYWGVILCKFGVEYVEDPKTRKRVPTCHRTSYDAIVTDVYYKEAIKNADVIQRTVYEREAQLIDEIQKGIIAISSKEEPFDVFISYKEKDENGNRTVDSVLANDIYYQLVNEGLKVFYSAITLEDKLGEEYEPYIFSALNSAKVMLVVGTKPEYFNAVWVKNEWSRFLKIIKKDRTKKLIPCYRDMDPYDLPEEFGHIQAQDMSKIGFITDVVRGIKKIVEKKQFEKQPKYAFETEYEKDFEKKTDYEVNNYAKRARLLLEDGDFVGAENYADKILDIESENAEAYLIKFMARSRIKAKNDLRYKKDSFANDPDFRKAVRFGEEVFSEELTEICNERDYNQARDVCLDARTFEDYRYAKALLMPLGDYRNCRSLVEMCDKKINRLETLKIKERTDEILYSDTLSPMAEAACKAVEQEKKVNALKTQINPKRKSSCIITLIVSAVCLVCFIWGVATEVNTFNSLAFVGTFVATPILFFMHIVRYNKKHLLLYIILSVVTVLSVVAAVPFIMICELYNIKKIKDNVEKETRILFSLRKDFETVSQNEENSVKEMIKALAAQGIPALKIADMIAEEKIEYN